jgi:hypothetical protein
MVGCMIHAHSLALEYWEKDISCVVHIQNIFLHKALKGMNPFEAWCGRNMLSETSDFLGPSIGHTFLWRSTRD